MAPKPQPLWHEDQPASIGVDNPLWHSDWETDDDPLLFGGDGGTSGTSGGSSSLCDLDPSGSRRSSQTESIVSSIARSHVTSEFAASFYESAGLAPDVRVRRFRKRVKPKASDPCGYIFVFLAFIGVCVVFFTSGKDKDADPNAATFQPYICETALHATRDAQDDPSSVASPLHLAMQQFSELDGLCASDALRSTTDEDCTCVDPTQPVEMDAAIAAFPNWKDGYQQRKAKTQHLLQDTTSFDVVFLGQSLSLSRGFDDVLEQANGLDMTIEGERTSTLLYELEDDSSSIQSLHAKIWWITIGTNDVADMCDLDAVHVGVLQVVDTLQQLHPQALFVLNADTDSSDDDSRRRNLSQRLSCIANSVDNVRYFDSTSGDVDSDAPADKAAAVLDTIRGLI